jgi:hypothetical protein
MNMTGIQLTLLMGKFVPLPVAPWTAEALASVDVTHSDSGPSTFQITFNADRASALSTVDYPLLLQQTVAIGNRVIIIATVGGFPHVLMDGLITHQELAHTRESGASTISATGEDISVAMDLNQIPMSYPGFGDEDIVATIVAKYEMFGIIPTIIPTLSDVVTIPLEWVPQQNCTDRAYLKKLAAKHGYVVMVRPGPLPGTNTLYWGPPPRMMFPQSALTVDMGPATNVEQISFAYDGLAPELQLGVTQDDETELDIPIATLVSTRMPPFASEPAILFQFPFVRTALYNDPRWDGIEALAWAQSQTDYSMDRVVTADGTVDTLRYNHVLETPGTVGLRGAGYSYDGIYYVNSVKHTIARGSYRQTFQLSREGLGSITPVVLP